MNTYEVEPEIYLTTMSMLLLSIYPKLIKVRLQLKHSDGFDLVTPGM